MRMRSRQHPWPRPARPRPWAWASEACIEPLEPRLLLSATLTGDALHQALDSLLMGQTDLAEINLQLPAEFRDSLYVAQWNGRRAVALESQWIADFGDGWRGRSASRLQSSLNALPVGSLLPGGVSAVRNLGAGQYLLEIPDAPGDYQALTELLGGVGGFESLEPNMPLWSAATFPDDPALDQLWGLHNTGQTGGTPDADIDAPEAWDLHTGTGEVVVGVIDTGLDTGINPSRPLHPDLAANLWTNPGEIAGDGIDNDGNGYIDDIHGWDFINEDNDPQDGHGHGTHVSGTIAGVGDDGSGVVGVNWSAQIMALKFLSDAGSGNTADAIEAVNYANSMRSLWLDSGGTQGANIRLTSNSWGGGAESEELRDAIAEARDLDMLFVVAAGNSANNNDVSDYWPANYGLELDNVIAVAATDHNDQRAGFSSYGETSVHLGAPGVAVYSTLPDGQYASWSGTSMATPHVAGVAALAWSFDPLATYQDVKQAILDGVDPVEDLEGLVATGGRLNAANTLLELAMTVRDATPGSGDVLTEPPTEFSVTFDDPFDPASVDATDLTVNGVAADSVSISDAFTAVFTFDTSPVTTEGPQEIRIEAGNILRDVDARGNVLWTATFRYDVHRMQVVATDPPIGSLVELPMTGITLTLDEDVVASSISAEDLRISQGFVRDGDDADDSAFTIIDSRTIRFDLDFVFREEPFTITVPAGAFKDQYGNPSVGFVAEYQLDYAGIILPDSGLFRKLSPDGALTHEYVTSATVGAVGNEDEFALPLDAAQRLSIVATSQADLQLEMELVDPEGNILRTVSAAAAGDVLRTEGVAIDQASDADNPYILRIRGLDDTTGLYDLRLLLNAVVEHENYQQAGNDSIADAQSLDGTFTDTAGGGQIVGVVGAADADFGSIIGPDGFGYAARNVDYQWEDISTTAEKIVYTIEHISPADLDGFRFPLYGVEYNSIYFNDNGVITFGSAIRRGSEPTDLATNPLEATIGPYWNYWMGNGQGSNKLPDTGMYWEMRGQGTDDERLIIQWHGMSMVNHNTPKIYFQTLLYADGRIRFNYRDIDYGHPYDGTAQSTTGIKGVGAGDDNRLLINYRDENNPFVGDEKSILISTEVAEPDIDGGDYYKLTLETGQTASLAARFNGARGEIELYDADATLLAVGSDTIMPGGQGINAFTADRTGQYVVRVLGGGEGNDYTLTVTRDADFDFDRPSGYDDAQALVTGALVGWAGRPELAPENYGSLDVLYWEDRDGSNKIGEVIDALLPDAVAAADVSELVDHMIAQPWDLVVINQGMRIQSQWVPYLESHLAGGGAGIVFDWTNRQIDGADARPTGMWNLGSISEVLVAGEHHPIWDGVGSGFSPASGIYRLITWGLEPIDDGVVIGTFSAHDGHDAIIVGADGRSVINGWHFDAVTRATAYQMLENQLLYTLDSAFAERDDWYSINLETGATLEAAIALPAIGDGEFVNTLEPVLELYGPDDAVTPLLVDDDHSDGTTLTYAAAAGGTYRLRIYGDAGQGNYVLTTDATDAPSPPEPFRVLATTPSDGARLAYQPKEIHLDVNDSILLTSVQPGDIRINGLAAGSVQLADGDTLSFTLPEGLGDGTYTVTIAAGAMTDTQGTPIEAHSWTYSADATFPTVVSTSIEENGLVAPGPVSIDVVFSEDIDQGPLSSDDFVLTGSAVGSISPTSWSYDPDSHTLTLDYANLPEDFYTLKIASGDEAVQDLVGYDLDGNADLISGDPFFLHFAAGVASEPIPTPFQQLGPLGGQIYTRQVDGALPAGGTKAYTVDLDAGQTFSVALTAGGGLQAQVDLIGPGGQTLASAAAAQADASVLLAATDIDQAGQYTLAVRALSGSAGSFTADVLLNASFEAEGLGAATNDEMAGAQALTGLDLGNGRLLNVRGSLTGGDLLEGPNMFGYEAMLVDYQWEDIAETGTIVMEPQGTISRFYLDDPGDFEFSFYDATYQSIGLHEYGALMFAEGGLKSTPWANTDLSSQPTAATIAPLWDIWGLDGYDPTPENDGVYWEVRGQGASRRLIVQWEKMTYASMEDHPITFQAILYEATGEIRFNYERVEGRMGNPNFNYYGASSTIGIKDHNNDGADRLLLYYGQGNDNSPAPWMDNEISIRIGTDIRDLADWYVLDLAAGQTFTAGAIADDGASAADLKLYDADGNLLATGQAGSQAFDAAVTDYTVGTAGTYYLEVAGASGEYSLVVTEAGAFDAGGNDDAPAAQDLDAANYVVGGIDDSTGDAEDWYSFAAQAGQVIRVAANVPASGQGQFENGLDPRIELYDPNQTMVASDQGDDQEPGALLEWTAETTGTYLVRVIGASAAIAPQPGLVGDYYGDVPYSGNYLSDFPDYAALTPSLTLIDGPIDILDDGGPDGQGTGFNGTSYVNNFAVQWNGYVYAETAGSYTFHVNSDDGSRLLINDQQIIDNGGPHGFIEKSATVSLDAGYHAIGLDFFDAINAAGITLSWTPPGQSKQIIPLASLFQSPAGQAASGQYVLHKSVQTAPAEVVGRHLFYNNSYGDGFNAAASSADDSAIAAGKTALLPGSTATSANHTAVAMGINGMMVDVENLASAPSADDFVFRVGPGGDPASWASAPAPTIALRAGAGVGNSDRITFIWQDGQIVNQWLQVTALSDANGGGLGLEADDVFYFGNLAGDFDADRTVDDDDARRILHHYRMADVAVADGDIDANNRVNLGDIRRLRDSFGLSLAEFTAPAPAEPDVITQADEALTEPATPITTIGDPGAVEPAEPVLAPRVAPASAATVDSLAALPDGLLASALEADDLATSPEPIEHADLAIRMARTWSAPRLSAPPAPQVTPPEAITEPDVETATHSRDVQPPARDASVVVDLLEQLEVLEPPVGPSL